MTMQDFIKSAGLTMTVKPADQNPNMVSDKEHARMTHYACTIRAGRSRMTIPFSMGSALTHEPTLPEVLDCLASDSAGFANARDFNDWCAEYGYDTDSRKAERTYRTIETQAGRLKRMLGDSAYETLLFNTDRD